MSVELSVNLTLRRSLSSSTHLAAGAADGIMTALLFAVEVGLPARTTDLRLLAVSLRKLPV